MEKILDRETTIEKTNSWVTIIVSNISIISVISTVLFFVLSERLFEIGSVTLTTGLIILLLWNIGMTCKLYFSSSSDWKKWAVTSSVFLLILVIIAFAVYIFATNFPR